MPDLRGLLADPQFNALPLERRQAILTKVNPQLAAEYVSTHQDAPQASQGAPGQSGGIRPIPGVGKISATPWYQQDVAGGYSAQDALSALPAVGGFVGGLLGAPGGATAVGGAALGGAGGEAARQLAMRALSGTGPATSGQAAKQIGVQGAIQGGAEGLGRGVVGVGRRALAPFAGEVSQEVVGAAARQGVEMPAAALSNSRVVPTVEAIAAKGVGGQEASKRYVEATSHLTVLADHAVRRASSLPDASAAGESIAGGLARFRATWMREKSALYKAAALPEKGLKVEAKQTVDLLNAIIEGKKDAAGILRAGPVADASFYRGLRDGLTKTVEEGKWIGEEFVKTTRRVVKPVEAAKLLQAKRELLGKIKASFADAFTEANKGALKKVSATMDGEFRAALVSQNPGLAAKLAVANTAYKDGRAKINSTFGTAIHRLEKDKKYDKIARAIANSRMSVNDIPKIIEVAGQEGADGMRMVVLADLVSKAKGPGGQLTPQGLARAMKTFGEDKLEALLMPDQLAKLKDLATLSASLQRGQKVMEGSQTAYLLSNMNATAALIHIAHAPARKFLGSKSGQRWLTSGYSPIFATEASARRVTGAAHAATVLFAEDE